MRPTQTPANAHHSQTANDAINVHATKNTPNQSEGLMSSSKPGARAAARLRSIKLPSFLNTRLLVTLVAIALVATAVCVRTFRVEASSAPAAAASSAKIRWAGHSFGGLMSNSGVHGPLAAYLAPMPAAGVCDATLPDNIEVEGTILGTTPLAYPTLAAAFTAINTGVHTGAISIDVCGNTTETASAVLNASGGTSSYTTITMSPVGTRTISGSIAGHLIDLNGADNVTINGLGTLTIENTLSAATPTAIRFIADATNNIVMNCTIKSAETATTLGTIFFSTGTATGNDGNLITSNTITSSGANFATNAIYSLGTSAAIDNSGNTVSSNNISDYFNAAAVTNGILLGATGNSGWTIFGNKLFQTATRIYTTGLTHNGISVLVGSGYAINFNTIGFANAGGTGTTNMVGNTVALTGTFPTSYTTTGTANATRYIAINAAFTAAGTVSNIQGNTVAGIALYSSSGAATTNGILCGINVTSGNANIGTTTGNTIGATTGQGSLYSVSNGGGGATVGIFATSTNTVTIQNNTIGAIDAVGVTSTQSGSFNGIDTAGTGGVFNISSNFIGNTTADNIRIGFTQTAGSLSNTGTFVSTTGTTGVMAGVRNSATGALTMNSNTLRGWANGTTSTGAVVGVTSTGVNTTSVAINSNLLGTSALGWIRYAFANTGTLTGINATGPAAAATLSISTNDFRGIVHSVAGTTAHTYVTWGHANSVADSINSNTFTNLNVNTAGSATFFNRSLVNMTSTGSLSVSNNQIVTGFNKGTAGGSVTVYTNSTGSSSPNGSTILMNLNNFSNVTLTGATPFTGLDERDGPGGGSGPTKTISNNTFNSITTGAAQITGISHNFSGNGSTVTGNTLSNLTSAGVILAISTGASISGATGTVSSNTLTNFTAGGQINALQTAFASALTTGNINNNTITAISSSGAANPVFGIIESGFGVTTNVFKNKIGNIQSDNAGATVFGILAQTAGTTHNIFNNLVGDLRTPSSTVAASNQLQGISIGAGMTTANVYYNTVYLNSPNTGATFGSSAVSVSSSPTVVLRNNIFVNTSVFNGAGLTVAYRRTTTTLTTYGAASNNNDFYAGTPGTNNLIFHDGTNSDQTLAAYKTRVGPTRDAASVTENPPLNTTASSPQFLHITNATGGSQVLNAGAPIAGFTDDYDADTRDASTPDMGADEVTTMQFSSATYTVAENVGGGVATITVTRSAGSGNAATVNYATSDGSATGGASCSGFPVDYVNASGTLSFAAGETSKTFNVTICNDGVVEPNETVNLTLSAPTGSLLGTPNTAVLTITNDDAAYFRSVTTGPWNLTSTWEESADNVVWVPATSTPTSANNTITVRSPHTVTVTAAVNADQLTVDSGGTLAVNSGITLTIDDGSGTDLTVNGTANMADTGLIDGAGSFTLSAGGTLGVGSTAGISTSGATGNIQNTGTRTFTAGANYVYNGTAAQVTGNALASAPNNLTIDNPTSVTSSVSGLTVTGLLQIIQGTFVSASDYNNVQIDNPATLSLSGDVTVSGSWTNNGTFTPSGNEVAFDGGSNQNVGGTGANNFADLKMNGAGVTLTADASVSNLLTLTTGKITTGLNTLSLGGLATATGGSGASYVLGNLKKTFSGEIDFTFDVGTTNGYSPVEANVTAGTGDLTVKATQTNQTVLNPATSLKRYWTLTEGGAGIIADLTFHYLDDATDVAGNEANYRLIVVESGNATNFPNNCPNVVCVDTTANTIKKSGVDTFSDWTAGEPNAPTAVKLTGFTAVRSGDEVMLRWQSGYEASNLGYNIYREQNGKRVQITPSLVAGSALIAGRQTQLTAGLNYTWYDKTGAGGRRQEAGVSDSGTQHSALSTQHSSSTYWLEDVDLNGTRTLHGPIAVSECGGGDCKRLSERSRLFGELTPQSAIRSLKSGSGVEFNGGPATTAGPDSDIIGTGDDGESLEMQRTIAGMAALKISVSQAGWYRISQPEAAAAGFTVVDAKHLQLYRNGRQVPFSLSNTADQFGPTDYLEFYGEGLNSTTDKAQTYYLIDAQEAGKRIRGDKATQWGDPEGPQSFAYTVERKERMIYFSGLLNGEAENFFGQVVNSTASNAALPVSHIDSASQMANVPSQLEVVLQGVSSQSHLVQVRINGTDLGTISFANTEHPNQTFSVPAAAIHDGNNTVELTALGGATDVSLVDVLRLTYVREFAADNNTLTFSVNSQQTKRVTGFSNEKVRVVDVTDPYNPVELVPVVSPDGGGFMADVQARASLNRPHTLVAFAERPPTVADALRLNEPSSWWSETAGADYVIITTAELKPSVQSLAQLRTNQGMVVHTVDVEDLYDEFSFGKHTPQALRDFLQRAVTSWTRQPHYVLFAGDASYDPKNYAGLGLNDLVPTRLIDTALAETASDDWLADFNGDGIADLALGRLPVRTVAETSALVSKIVNYENATPDPSRGAVLVADNGFEAPSSVVQGLLPAGMTVQTINRNSADDATIHNQIITGLNQGPLVTNYIGHGSNGVWTGASLLSILDAPSLTNTNRLTVFTMMTCFNGYFQDAYNESLSEALLKSQGGAVAVWASTTLTDPAGQNAIDQEFYRLLFGAQPQTLGDAARAAKVVTTDADVRRTWTLLGDPAMRLR